MSMGVEAAHYLTLHPLYALSVVARRTNAAYTVCMSQLSQ